MLPNDGTFCELDPELKDQWGVPVLRFHWKWTDFEYNQVRHQQQRIRELLEAAGGKVSSKADADVFKTMKPGGSVILATLPHVMAKKTIHPHWPSFQSERGKAIHYGPDICPNTIDILQRYGGVLMDPKFTRKDIDDIVAAIRKVYQAVGSVKR